MKNLDKFPCIEVNSRKCNGVGYVPHIEAHVDPKWKDIVINGSGIKKSDAKRLRDWLTKAIRVAK